jgi:hypothetical protein
MRSGFFKGGTKKEEVRIRKAIRLPRSGEIELS